MKESSLQGFFEQSRFILLTSCSSISSAVGMARSSLSAKAGADTRTIAAAADVSGTSKRKARLLAITAVGGRKDLVTELKAKLCPTAAINSNRW